MKKPPFLTKTCSSCGQEKPLSAFLLLTKQGTAYGSICSACRKTAKSKEYEDSTTSKTGLKIDTKARIHSEIDKQEKFEQIEDAYYEERDEKEIQETDRLDTKQDRTDKEKKHRHEHLSKRGFLSKPAQTPSAQHQVQAQQNKQAQLTEHATKLAQATEENKKLSEVDVNEMSKDTYVAGKVKNQGEATKRLMSFLGTSSAIGRALQQKNHSNTENKETAQTFPDKHWNPNSRKL